MKLQHGTHSCKRRHDGMLTFDIMAEIVVPSRRLLSNHAHLLVLKFNTFPVVPVTHAPQVQLKLAPAEVCVIQVS